MKNSPICVYCGEQPGLTRDHVPSRVLLDDPYPVDVRPVDACSKCNSEGLSLDEEYLACLLDCVTSGTTDPKLMKRQKVREILENKPALRARLEKARTSGASGTIFEIEYRRVTNVLNKLVLGHAYFEHIENKPVYEQTIKLHSAPIHLLSEGDLDYFESPPVFWPEVGAKTRRGQLTLERTLQYGDSGWIEVQPGRYRYLVFNDGLDLIVRVVLSEYLAVEAVWEASDECQ